VGIAATHDKRSPPKPVLLRLQKDNPVAARPEAAPESAAGVNEERRLERLLFRTF
jgi:hypothetical protein